MGERRSVGDHELRAHRTARPPRFAPTAVSPITEDEKADLIRKTKCFIFDCDGVIWRCEGHARLRPSARRAAPALRTLTPTVLLIGSQRGAFARCRGDTVIEGVPETLAMLRQMGKKLFFVTNNSTKSRKGYLKKFTSLGLDVKAEVRC